MTQFEDEGFSHDVTPAMVIDNGSGVIKGGFSGEDRPRISMRTMTARDSSVAPNELTKRFETMHGDDLDDLPTDILESPMKRGLVDDFERMELVWDAMFEKLQPIDMPVLLTEATENPKHNRIEMAQIMFEKYKVPACYFAYQPVLSLYSTGRTTGLVLDIGHGVTQTAPIFEGFTLSHAVSKSNFGGSDLTEYMQTILIDMQDGRRDSGRPSRFDGTIPFGSIRGHKLVTTLKENMCAVAMDFKEAITDSTEQREFTLPDRTVITVGPCEIYSCGEALFDPGLVLRETGSDLLGIHEHVYKVYSKCDDHMRRFLDDNIVLSGGSSMFAGIKPRLEMELEVIQHAQRMHGALSTSDIKVDCQRERHHCCWVGGSLLASFSTFKDLWISKAEFDEGGQSILFSK